MKNKIILFFLLIFSAGILFAGGNKENAETEKSNSANYIVPTEVPKRTVVGTVAMLDMLDYLEIPFVACPNTRRQIPSKYKNLPRIGMPMNPDMEKLKQVNPDFFITVNSLQAALEPKVKAAKINSVFLKTDSCYNFLDSVSYLGKVYKKEEKANAYIKEVKDKIAAVLKANKGEKAPKVLILFGTPRGLSIATEFSFVGDLVKVLGGKNIWTDTKTKSSYLPINMELIKASNPDVILRMTHVAPEMSRKMFKKEFSKDFWQSLDAVKNDRVHDLNNDFFMVSGNIHIPRALEDLNKFLYTNK